MQAPVLEDMKRLDMSLRNIVGERHPMLMAAAEQIFGAGGKRIRPMLVLLVARATAQLGGLPDLRPEHRRLAEITEMIHTASLVHDDVLDDSNKRRGERIERGAEREEVGGGEVLRSPPSLLHHLAAGDAP